MNISLSLTAKWNTTRKKVQLKVSSQLRNVDKMSSANECACLSRRPFHVEPRNIIEDSALEQVSAEASALNSRVHYYGRLSASSDRLLVIYVLFSLFIKLNTPTNDFTCLAVVLYVKLCLFKVAQWCSR